MLAVCLHHKEKLILGSCPDSACVFEGALDCKGVAGPKPSDAWEGAASPHRAKPGSGREPTRVGSAAGGALGCMGVAGSKPSDAGEGAACLSPRAKPGSGQEPTLVGSGRDSACAAEGEPGCKGVAGPKPT